VTGAPEPADNEEVTTARLLAVLWENLVDVLGTAAAATVLRRAVKRACVRLPELAELRVERDRWDYRCTSPEGWDKRTLADTPAFIELVRSELYPLLQELTGPIVLRRLERVPELRQVGLSRPEEK
jgi:hypothetical protein